MERMEGKWTSRRSCVYAKNGMVATSQPLASEIGLRILQKGGNAADAAVGIAAALNLVQPWVTGLGGDAFVMFYDAQTKRVKGLNATGRAPKALSMDVIEGMGFSQENRPRICSSLWATVPGSAAGWVDTLELFGNKKLSMSEILEPSIKLAQEGFPVCEVSAHFWKKCSDNLRGSAHGSELLLPGGRAPSAGDIFRNPGLATTFKDLALHGKPGFYQGRVAEEIVQALADANGGTTLMTQQDLLDHFNTYDEPICTSYRGYDVYELPPNGQGITALVALNILEGFDIGKLEYGSAEHLHYVIESLRLAFADTRHYVADPTYPGVKVPVDGMLSRKYAEERRSLITPGKAMKDVKNGYPADASNTVYFCVVDGAGNACSFINSIYMEFGCGVVPKGTGFALHNRGDNFSLDRNHVNCLAPGKRPYHTIIPGMVLRNGELHCPMGVMGGFMQPQGHVQVLSNMFDFGMSPQEALDAPRIFIGGGKAEGQLFLEDGIDAVVREKLAAMGHNNPAYIRGRDRTPNFGVGQIIVRNPETGVLCAGSDGRNDSMAMGW